MKLSLLTLSSVVGFAVADFHPKLLRRGSPYSNEADILQFSNVGYDGFYYPVSKIEAVNASACSCSLDVDNPIKFSGPISPLDEELSVHLRGPVNLRKFAWYTTSSYSYKDTTGNWNRGAYFDAETGETSNVTFLGNVGTDNLCLGRALDYTDETGLEIANSSTVLGNVTIPSSEEITIMSGVECEGDSCGVYRSDSKAYHGFYGVNKMFLFEFAAPSDLSEETLKNKTDGYDMTAIWLLNAQIPRTAQYPTNSDCSSWGSGSGEFDIFEIVNDTERTHFYSTIHDFQGIEYISEGIQNYAYLERTPESVMKGGVIFGEDGTATVFLSNSTTFDDSIANTDINSWLDALSGSTHDETLLSISVTPASSTAVSSIHSAKSNAAAGAAGDSILGHFTTIFYIILGLLYV
ncbi:Toh1 protein [Martiniozyma asiatica (nom. inval.)]|nr:Toh1 protein [Martiniozyma asiatica]